MKRKVLITGVSGMLGQILLEELSKEKDLEIFGTARNVNGKNLISGDLTDIFFIEKLFSAIKPEIIIHTAAITNLKFCEENPNLAFDLHVKASENLASFPSQKFIYISTDSVFDGIKGNYSEKDLPNPLNIYAETKLLGEKKVLKNHKNALVLRTNLYGITSQSGNALAEWAIGALIAKKSISGFSDVFFNPLYTKQFSKIILKIIQSKQNLSGILNLGSQEKISKYEFILKLTQEFNLDEKLIQKANSDDFKSAINRPKNTSLNLQKMESIFKELPSLTDGIVKLKKDFNLKTK